MPALRRLRAHPAAPVYHIVRRDGAFLRDASRTPFEWTDRESAALAFRSRRSAEALVWGKFGSAMAREMSGIHVVEVK